MLVPKNIFSCEKVAAFGTLCQEEVNLMLDRSPKRNHTLKGILKAQRVNEKYDMVFSCLNDTILQSIPTADHGRSMENGGTIHSQASGQSVNSGEKEVIATIGNLFETNETSASSKTKKKKSDI